MSEALTRGMFADGAEDQTTFRHPGKWYDQHDRLWDGLVEKRSGHPTGNLSLRHKTPLGNRPPWEPDQGYLVLDKDDPTAINIDYERMLTDRLAAREEWNKHGVDVASARSWEIPESKDEYGYYPFAERIVAVIGKRPASWVPVKAAMDGNRWILGFTDSVDERIEPFVTRVTTRQNLTEALPSFASGDEETVAVKRTPVIRTRAQRVKASQQGAA